MGGVGGVCPPTDRPHNSCMPSLTGKRSDLCSVNHRWTKAISCGSIVGSVTLSTARRMKVTTLIPCLYSPTVLEDVTCTRLRKYMQKKLHHGLKNYRE